MRYGAKLKRRGIADNSADLLQRLLSHRRVDPAAAEIDALRKQLAECRSVTKRRCNVEAAAKAAAEKATGDIAAARAEIVTLKLALDDAHTVIASAQAETKQAQAQVKQVKAQAQQAHEEIAHETQQLRAKSASAQKIADSGIGGYFVKV